MTRRPQHDYFCHFCLKDSSKLYCKYCAESTVLEYAMDHYVLYYAAYYSKYYDSFYAEVYTDEVSKQHLKENNPDGGPGNTGRQDEGEG